MSTYRYLYRSFMNSHYHPLMPCTPPQPPTNRKDRLGYLDFGLPFITLWTLA